MFILTSIIFEILKVTEILSSVTWYYSLTTKIWFVILQKNETEENPNGFLNVYTSNHLCCIKLRAEPLPMTATDLLEKSTDILRALSEQQTDSIADTLERLKLEDSVSKNIQATIDTFRSQLQEALGDGIDVTQIWAFGPRKCGPNILLNKIPSMLNY